MGIGEFLAREQSPQVFSRFLWSVAADLAAGKEGAWVREGGWRKPRGSQGKGLDPHPC